VGVPALVLPPVARAEGDRVLEAAPLHPILAPLRPRAAGCWGGGGRVLPTVPFLLSRSPICSRLPPSAPTPVVDCSSLHLLHWETHNRLSARVRWAACFCASVVCSPSVCAWSSTAAPVSPPAILLMQGPPPPPHGGVCVCVGRLRSPWCDYAHHAQMVPNAHRLGAQYNSHVLVPGLGLGLGVAPT
jgi:hypothetical protein